MGTNEGLPVHTDWNFWKRSEAYPEIQGGICLADCPVGGGGFFCIPGTLRLVFDRVCRFQLINSRVLWC